MTYFEELESLYANVGMTREEIIALNKLSDQIVGIKMKKELSDHDKGFIRIAMRRLKENNLFVQFTKIVESHTKDNLEDFFRDF